MIDDSSHRKSVAAMTKSNLIKSIPNILTTANMLCGLTAVIILIQTEFPGNKLFAAGLIVFGGIIDFFDGFLARRLKASSELGKQLDSFADLVTFGIAPFCMLHHMAIYEQSIVIAISSFAFLIAGVYRLARYNTGNFSRHFMGLPITAAGMLLAIYCALHASWASHLHHIACVTITTVLILLLSAAMVSRVKVKKPEGL